jgi:peptidyl-prolyl cis-trans isomerase B (cyclophilin B)
VTGEDAQLPPEYALLGKISAGQDVVDKIGVAETDPTSQEPLDPILIRSVKVTAG